MFYCNKCGYEFDKPTKIFETQGGDSPPFEEILICPDCKSTDFHEKDSTHCRCCGAKLTKDAEDYCSDSCRKKGELLWQKQLRRRKLQEENPLNSIIKEIINYNLLNKTDYSYGQYVALVENKRGKRKCKRKKKNT